MVTTATRPKTRKPALEDLFCIQVAWNRWRVESQSMTLGSHDVVKSSSTGRLVCDRDCIGYRRNQTCRHCERVQMDLDALPAAPIYGDSCCLCLGPAGDIPGCECPHHTLLGPSVPLLTTAGVEVASLPFALSAPEYKRVDCALSDMFDR